METTGKARPRKSTLKVNSATDPPAAGNGNSASELAALLDQIETLIPDYTHPDAETIHQIASTARFANELVVPTISAVTNYEPLRARNLFDVEAGRRALALRDELRPIAQRMATIASAVSFTVDKALAGAATDALQMYQWSKRHVRRPDGAALRPYVDEMRRVIARTINHRTRGQKTTEAPPSTSAPTSPRTT